MAQKTGRKKMLPKTAFIAYFYRQMTFFERNLARESTVPRERPHRAP
jgi:hypothetical protein